MKNVIAILGLLAATTVWADSSRTEASRGLFAQALTSNTLADRLHATPDAEIIGIEQVFVPNGRGSHTNFEITYGVPDGTGGYRTHECAVLKLLSDASMPGNHGQAQFAPSEENCH